MAKKLRIVSRVDGFRRGGLAHPAKETLYDLDAFSNEQRQAIEAESNLIVDVVDVKDDKEPDGDSGKDDAKPDAPKAGAAKSGAATRK